MRIPDIMKRRMSFSFEVFPPKEDKPLEPLLDSRFRSWAAGDTYSIYPGNRSSIRFEKLLEGIQDFEKIRILRDRFKASGNDKALSELESLLLPLRDSQIDVNSLPALVKSLESVLNR